jgi:uncharacterized protein (DUF2267 family)
MKHDEFIGQVQHRARLSSRGDAKRASWATLQTLGERLAASASICSACSIRICGAGRSFLHR